MNTKKETVKKDHDDRMHSRSRGKQKCLRLKSRTRPGEGPYATLPCAGLVGVDRCLQKRSQSDSLPASVEFGNLMVATWVIGAECEVGALSKALSTTPFDAVVLTRTTAVADDHLVLKFLSGLSTSEYEQGTEGEAWQVLNHKCLYQLNGRRRKQKVFVAVHRAKVMNAWYDGKYFRSRGKKPLALHSAHCKST